MVRKFAAVTGWSLLLAIAIATLVPLNLRPGNGNGTDVGLQHLLPFVAVGFLLCLGYPRHWLLVALFLSGATITLELAQLLTPDRHARIADALTKLGGLVAGVAAGLAANYVTHPPS